MTLTNIRFGAHPTAPETSPEILAAGRAHLAARAECDAAFQARYEALSRVGAAVREALRAEDELRKLLLRAGRSEWHLIDGRRIRINDDAGGRDRLIVIETDPREETD